MRFHLAGRAKRALIALCAIALAGPSAAIAASGGSSAPAAPAALQTKSAFTVSVSDRNPSWGKKVVVHGRAVGTATGRAVVLQFRTGSAAWRTIATDRIGAKGTYRFSTRIPSRGAVRVALAPTAGTAVLRAQGAASTPAEITSGTHVIRVHATLSLGTRKIAVSAGTQAIVAGHVNPHRAGRLVVAQRRSGNHWTRVASDRTDRTGAYRLTWRPTANGSVRIVAGPDAVASGVTRSAGQVSVLRMRNAVASRYDDYGGPLACSNGTLGYNQLGVAHKTLPCGTKVTIRYHGRTVVAPVIDRGPFVAGREFDLTGATARALGFNGVGTIQVSTS